MKTRVVDKHPQKEKIIAEILEGVQTRVIADRYGIGFVSVHRYKKALGEKAVVAAKEKEVGDSRYLWDKLEEVIGKTLKMLDSCDEYLQHPTKPDRYFLGPTADDIEVSYYDLEDGKPAGPKKVATLQELLGRTENVAPVSWKARLADPREILLESSRTMGKHLELLARIQGQIKETTFNLINSNVWVQIQQALMDATAEDPEARERIARNLNAIANTGGEPESNRISPRSGF